MHPRWFVSLLVSLFLFLGHSSLAFASEDPAKVPDSEGKASEETKETEAPASLERIRVLKEDAGVVVTKGMNFVRSTKQISWWSADVFGREGYVRIVACRGEEKKPECYEVRLSDPGDCSFGTKTGNWCVSFPSQDADEWVQSKLSLHPFISEDTAESAWNGSGLEDTYAQEVFLGAFKGSEAAFAIAAKPGVLNEGREFEETHDDALYFRGADTPTEIQILLEALLALILFGLCLRRVDASQWSSLLAWTALVIGAFSLRYLFGFQALFHENHHGFSYLAAILNGHGQTFGIPSSYITLMHPLAHFAGGTDDSVFLMNGLFNALCVPLLGLLVRDLTGKAWAGWLAAIMWAITPHAIRVSTTEIYFNFSAFMLLAATLASVRGFRAYSDESVPRIHVFLLVGLATLLVAISAQVRVLTLVYPLAVALVVWASGHLATKQQWTLFAVLAAVVASLCIPQLVYLLEALDQPERSSGLVSAACLVTNGQDFIFFDPSIVSPILLAFAGIGGVFAVQRGLFRSRVAGAAFVGAVLWIVILAGVVCGVEVSRIRFEVPAHTMLTALGAMGIWGIAEWARKRSKMLMTLVVTVSLAGILSPLVFLDRMFQDPMEYAFLRDAVIPSLKGDAGDKAVVLIQPGHIADEFGGLGPDWWDRQLPGIDVIEKVSNIPDIEGIDPPKMYTYLGLDCFWATPGFEEIPYPKAEHVGGLRIHPVCAASLVGADWKPVVELDVTREDTVGSCVDIQEERIAVGLYVGRRQ